MYVKKLTDGIAMAKTDMKAVRAVARKPQDAATRDAPIV